MTHCVFAETHASRKRDRTPGESIQRWLSLWIEQAIHPGEATFTIRCVSEARGWEADVTILWPLHAGFHIWEHTVATLDKNITIFQSCIMTQGLRKRDLSPVLNVSERKYKSINLKLHPINAAERVSLFIYDSTSSVFKPVLFRSDLYRVTRIKRNSNSEKFTEIL
jgi:hypothetical protein